MTESREFKFIVLQHDDQNLETAKTWRRPKPVKVHLVEETALNLPAERPPGYRISPMGEQQYSAGAREAVR